jgi:hypothetical protein
MPVPAIAELPAILGSGISSVVALGVELDRNSFEEAGIELLIQGEPDLHSPDEEQMKAFLSFCLSAGGAVAVCSHNNMATGNMLGVALISEGVSAEKIPELFEAVHSPLFESTAQIEYFYTAALMLGFELD